MPYRSKIDTRDLVRLNSLGLSLTTIAEAAGCHPTTVTQRLKEVGVPVIDTRRTFMEDVLITLPTEQIEWLEGQLKPQYTIKDFVRNLLIEAFISHKENHAKSSLH